ncbi:transposase [Trichonephila clavipes]|nr:transposase [Trichonephila clavipes]
MVTGDEKWGTYYNIVRKRSGSKRGEAVQTVAKAGLTSRKDNATPYAPVVIHQKLWEPGWEVLMHPPYSLDLEPNDCHLFLTLQNFQSDKKLESREDCQNRLLEFWANKGQDFYERGNMKLSLKWQQIIQQDCCYIFEPNRTI